MSHSAQKSRMKNHTKRRSDQSESSAASVRSVVRGSRETGVSDARSPEKAEKARSAASKDGAHSGRKDDDRVRLRLFPEVFGEVEAFAARSAGWCSGSAIQVCGLGHTVAL